MLHPTPERFTVEGLRVVACRLTVAPFLDADDDTVPGVLLGYPGAL